MKKQIKCLLIITIGFIFTMLLLNTKTYAGSQKLKDLKYNVILNTDGTADVIEEWNIKVSETNTLFKTFNLDSTKYGKITNVHVKDITGGINQEFFDTGVYAYHVEKGGFYALNRSYNEFEIAWGVSIESAETRTYQISYTITDAIKNYNDCSEFYWQFIGNTNAISASRIKGIIKLPEGIKQKENLRVWAHGPLDGNIEIVDNETVSFEVEDLKEETMVEVRIVTTDDIFVGNLNRRNYSQLQNILNEEGKWAEEANNKRRTMKTIIWTVIAATIIAIIFFLCKIIKYIKVLSKIEKPKPEMKYDYFRDFPDKKASAGEAAFLYYFDKNKAFNSNITKIVSGTVLNLALKKAILFKQTERDDVIIAINELAKLKEELTEDEMKVYEILEKAYLYKEKKQKNNEISGITMKDIEKYASKNDAAFLGKIESIEKIIEKSQLEKGNYDDKTKKEVTKWQTISMFYFVFAMFGIFTIVFIVPLILSIFSIINGVLCNKIANKLRMLTQKGVDEQEKWKALKRYMEEYSLLKEREVPELALWEKYLVYATAFGIADKVLKQLKITYPELANEDYMINNGYTYLYMINRININTAIAGGIGRAYASRNKCKSSKKLLKRRRSSEEDSLAEEVGGGRPVGRNGRKIISKNFKGLYFKEDAKM